MDSYYGYTTPTAKDRTPILGVKPPKQINAKEQAEQARRAGVVRAAQLAYSSMRNAARARAAELNAELIETLNWNPEWHRANKVPLPEGHYAIFRRGKEWIVEPPVATNDGRDLAEALNQSPVRDPYFGDVVFAFDLSSVFEFVDGDWVCCF